MTLIDSLTREFAREAKTTRTQLERLPGDQLDWRPHPKSFTAGALASHMIDCVRSTDWIFSMDEYDFDPASYKPCPATSVSSLLSGFDDDVAKGARALAGVTDADLWQPWRFKVKGRLMFERPKAAVFRDFTLSHLIHHRGQFSVYLRLLNVPVPGSYGPSADERTP
jgi:uncharacterized damage-inducible protein DinB